MKSLMTTSNSEVEGKHFCHLHRHSEFSLLDGCGTAKQYAERAVEIGHKALALTDHGSLSGILHHYAECKEHGIKPIFGMEAYFRYDRLDHTAENKKTYHMTMLAQNELGWQNLIKISADAWDKGFYYKPACDWSTISKYREGLIVGTGCLSSPSSRLILDNDLSGAEEFVREMIKVFGKNNVFAEIMPHDINLQRKVNLKIINIAYDLGIPVVATIDSHYPYADWIETQDILLMISTGQSLSRRKAKREAGEEVYTMKGVNTLYLMDKDEAKAAFRRFHKRIPLPVLNRALNNSGRIADQIDFIDIGKENKLPRVKWKPDSISILRKWCEDGLERIGKSKNRKYRRRFEMELAVLHDNNFIDFFLIIGEFVRWAQKEGIRSGVGRGSAAGSLICYLIGITKIDPIPHGLIFERFINPGRKGLPDIDIDFQHDRRDEIFKHIEDTWGKDKVAHIASYQRFRARAALADVSRVLDVPFEVVHRVTKQIPLPTAETKEETLEEIKMYIPAVQDFANAYPEVWKHAIRIEGQAKSLSQHPAGVIVTDKPTIDYAPLIRNKQGNLIVAWAESDDCRVTDFGFCKMDILSTDGLTIQAYALNLINKAGLEVPDIDALPPSKDPSDVDDKVMNIFKRGRTVGIFQFESSGLTNLLRQMQPTSVDDLAAANALYRPGPLAGGIAHAYGSRKNGREAIEFWDDSVQPVLAPTYGLMIYQEQAMQVVQLLAGFTPSQADDFRKATGKKEPKKMRELKKTFLPGAKKFGLDTTVAQDIWDKVLAFSGYSFNKAHASAYSMQAYQDAYLKQYFPLQFYAAIASYEREKIPAVIREASGRKITFLPPDINDSKERFVPIIKDRVIRFSFESIKGLGPAALEEILDQQPFYSYRDFDMKVRARKVNINIKRALVESGAFDRWGLRDIWPEEEKLKKEKERLGVMLSGDNLTAKYYSYIKQRIQDAFTFDNLVDGDIAQVGGEIIKVKKIVTRKGQPMAFIDIAFEGDSFSVTIFPPVWMQCETFCKEGEFVLVKGKKDEERSCILADIVARLTDIIGQE